MACCGGNVNVVSRSDADVTDAGVQTEEPYVPSCAEEEEDKVETPSDETEV